MRPAAAVADAPRNFRRLQRGSSDRESFFVPSMFTPSFI
jgi:hypothetical protein